jgi:uncharacterized protein (DUF433 family)
MRQQFVLPKLPKKQRMNASYVEQRDNAYWVAKTRVSLDSILYAFLNGKSAEDIAQSFPVLTLEQVYGAITYCLAHSEEMVAYLKARQLEYESKRHANREADPMFYLKLADAKRRFKKMAKNI